METHGKTLAITLAKAMKQVDVYGLMLEADAHWPGKKQMNRRSRLKPWFLTCKQYFYTFILELRPYIPGI